MGFCVFIKHCFALALFLEGRDLVLIGLGDNIENIKTFFCED